jgi:hypothetical protein
VAADDAVLGVRDVEADASEAKLVPRGGLDDVGKAAPANHAPGAPRDDDRQRPLDLRERRQVEVVEMHVRHEDDVEATERSAGNRLCAREVGDASAEHGIGDEPNLVDLDYRRTVAEPGDRVHVAAARPSGLRLGHAGMIAHDGAGAITPTR